MWFPQNIHCPDVTESVAFIQTTKRSIDRLFCVGIHSDTKFAYCSVLLLAQPQLRTLMTQQFAELVELCFEADTTGATVYYKTEQDRHVSSNQSHEAAAKPLVI